MSLADNLTQLQSILDGVTTPTGQRAIQKVFVFPQSAQVTTAEMPCLLVFTRKPSAINGFTFGTEKRVSEVVVQFAYCPVGQGNLEDNRTATLAYIENILDTLYADYELNGTANWALPKSASNPGKLPEAWNGTDWFGVDILIDVVASRGITLTP